MSQRDEDAKTAILVVLEELGEASTFEVMEEASKIASQCKDQAVSILMTLEKEKKVTKSISKEKKAIVWKLIQKNNNLK